MNGQEFPSLLAAANAAINDGKRSSHREDELNSAQIEVVADKLAICSQSLSQPDDARLFFQLCLSLARGIDYGVANSEIPEKASKLPPVLKQVCRQKHEFVLQAAIMVLMISVKNACKMGWFSPKDAEDLLTLVNEAAGYFSTMGELNKEASIIPTVSTIMSRFYPQYKLGQVIASLEVKPGYGTYLLDFHISKSVPCSPGEKIRLFVAMKDNIDTSSCIISPQKVNILLNGRPVEERTNVYMDPGPQFPTVVNPLLKYDKNLLQAVGQFSGHYIILLAFMSIAPSSSLPVPQDYVQPDTAMLSSESESEIIEAPSRVTLNCPVTYKRIGTPVKGHLCKHYQCFDFNNYIELNSKQPSWRCPHCNQSVCFIDLRFDQRMAKILQEVGENVSEVTISADGSWPTASGTNHKSHDKASADRQAQRGCPDSSGADACKVYDLTEEDDEMEIAEIPKPVDTKPVIHHNVQKQQVPMTSTPLSAPRSSNETQFSSGLVANALSGASLANSGSANSNIRSEAPLVGSGISPVLTDSVSPFNWVPHNHHGPPSSNSMPPDQMLVSQLSDILYPQQSIPRNVSRDPSANQALPVQMHMPNQQQPRPTVNMLAPNRSAVPFQAPLASPPHVHSAPSNIDRQRRSVTNPANVSNMPSASLLNRPLANSADASNMPSTSLLNRPLASPANASNMTSDSLQNRSAPRVLLEDFGGDGVDYSYQFVTDKWFDTIDDLHEWADGIAKGIGFRLVRASYKKGKEGGPVRLYLRCWRYGRYRGKVGTKDCDSHVDTKTKSCQCPFVIVAFSPSGQKWAVRSFAGEKGVHNHRFALYEEGHRREHPLTSHMKAHTREITDAECTPAIIHTSLKQLEVLGDTDQTDEVPDPLSKDMSNFDSLVKKVRESDPAVIRAVIRRMTRFMDSELHPKNTDIPDSETSPRRKRKRSIGKSAKHIPSAFECDNGKRSGKQFNTRGKKSTSSSVGIGKGIITEESDSEIIEAPSRVSLNCPISYKRIGTPVKGHLCKHYQCFDLNNYIELNSKLPSWRCPHCNQSVCVIDLCLDQRMAKILREVGENVSEVTISADGSWSTASGTNHKSHDKASADQQEQRECPDSSGADACKAYDVTEEDDGMEISEIPERVDMKPVIHHNVQQQQFPSTSTPLPAPRSTNETGLVANPANASNMPSASLLNRNRQLANAANASNVPLTSLQNCLAPRVAGPSTPNQNANIRMPQMLSQPPHLRSSQVPHNHVQQGGSHGGISNSPSTFERIQLKSQCQSTPQMRPLLQNTPPPIQGVTPLQATQTQTQAPRMTSSPAPLNKGATQTLTQADNHRPCQQPPTTANHRSKMSGLGGKDTGKGRVIIFKKPFGWRAVEDGDPHHQGTTAFARQVEAVAREDSREPLLATSTASHRHSTLQRMQREASCDDVDDNVIGSFTNEEFAADQGSFLEDSDSQEISGDVGTDEPSGDMETEGMVDAVDYLQLRDRHGRCAPSKQGTQGTMADLTGGDDEGSSSRQVKRSRVDSDWVITGSRPGGPTSPLVLRIARRKWEGQPPHLQSSQVPHNHVQQEGSLGAVRNSPSTVERIQLMSQRQSTPQMRPPLRTTPPLTQGVTPPQATQTQTQAPRRESSPVPLNKGATQTQTQVDNHHLCQQPPTTTNHRRSKMSGSGGKGKGIFFKKPSRWRAVEDGDPDRCARRAETVACGTQDSHEPLLAASSAAYRRFRLQHMQREASCDDVDNVTGSFQTKEFAADHGNFLEDSDSQEIFGDVGTEETSDDMGTKGTVDAADYIQLRDHRDRCAPGKQGTQSTRTVYPVGYVQFRDRQGKFAPGKLYLQPRDGRCKFAPGKQGTQGTRTVNAVDYLQLRDRQGKFSPGKQGTPVIRTRTVNAVDYVQLRDRRSRFARVKRGTRGIKTDSMGGDNERPSSSRHVKRNRVDSDWVVTGPMPSGPTSPLVIPNYEGHIARRVREGEPPHLRSSQVPHNHVEQGGSHGGVGNSPSITEQIQPMSQRQSTSQMRPPLQSTPPPIHGVTPPQATETQIQAPRMASSPAPLNKGGTQTQTQADNQSPRQRPSTTANHHVFCRSKMPGLGGKDMGKGKGIFFKKPSRWRAVEDGDPHHRARRAETAACGTLGGHEPLLAASTAAYRRFTSCDNVDDNVTGSFRTEEFAVDHGNFLEDSDSQETSGDVGTEETPGDMATEGTVDAVDSSQLRDRRSRFAPDKPGTRASITMTRPQATQTQTQALRTTSSPAPLNKGAKQTQIQAVRMTPSPSPAPLNTGPTPPQTQSMRMASSSPASIPLNTTGATPPQAVARTENQIDLQAEQSWRPAGRMRGSLKGQAYSAALSQLLGSAATQTSQAPIPGQSMPATPLPRRFQALANRLQPRLPQVLNRATDALTPTAAPGSQPGGPQG